MSLVLVIVLFAFTAGMAKVDTDTWQSDFMTVTLITVVIINLNAAIFQGKFIFKKHCGRFVTEKSKHFPIFSFVIQTI